MNAALRAVDVVWHTPVDAEVRECRDARTQALAARLALALARPLGLICEPWDVSPHLSAASLHKLAASRFFGAPVQRAASRLLGLDSLQIGFDFIERIARRPTTRLAIVLLTEKREILRGAALDLAACILQKRLVAVLLKSERAKLRAALGEAMDLGLQQAPMLYPRLAELELNESARFALAAVSEEETRKELEKIGFSGLFRVLEATEPQLANVFARRCCVAPGLTAACAERHVDQAMRLFRRRRASWSPIIG